ncbi:MAG: hypothetical protein HWE27_02170 [Gammaproteobacteria bacterium]|nr:hypothetical protein [Gammaproteobacteria bacterium]
MNSILKPSTIGLTLLFLLFAHPIFALGKDAKVGTATDIEVTGKTQLTQLIEEQAALLFKAAEQSKPLPLVSQTSHDQFNLSQTSTDPYLIQKQFVQLLTQNDTIIGFKAGLTSTAGQKKFGVNAPLTGVLFKKGVIRNRDDIRLSHYGKLMLETEFGFRVNQPINKPVESIDQLMAIVSSVAAVIELPDLRYTDLSKLTGFDLIASNVASAGILVGNSLDFSQRGTHPDISNINEINVSLSVRNADNNLKLVNQGTGSDALGNQWQALQLLINQTVSQGYTITPEHILITGALGSMVPAESGDYEARFGPLQSIKFSIKP